MRTALVVATALMVSTAANATTNLVTNGSFEQGINPAGTTFLDTDDTTSITGWKVLTTGINYVDNSAWNAASGSRSVELSTDAGRGGIWQRVEGFSVGYRYRLTFDVSANPNDPALRPKESRLITTLSGMGAKLNIYTLNDVNTSTNMLYQTVSYDFIATGTGLNLSFRSSAAPIYGPVIDSVSISVVPEASTWAMLLAGFGLVGFASRRRNRAAVAA